MCFDDYIVSDEVRSYAIYYWWMDAFFVLYRCIVKYALLVVNDIEKKYIYLENFKHIRFFKLYWNVILDLWWV